MAVTLIQKHSAGDTLIFNLEDDFSLRLGIKVDLVMKKAIKPHIGRHILEEVVPVRGEEHASSQGYR